MRSGATCTTCQHDARRVEHCFHDASPCHRLLVDAARHTAKGPWSNGDEGNTLFPTASEAQSRSMHLEDLALVDEDEVCRVTGSHVRGQEENANVVAATIA